MTLEERQEQPAEPERDRDFVMKRYAEMIPEALEALVPKERQRLYKRLPLRGVPDASRSLDVRGTPAGAAEDELCQSDPVCR